MYKFCQKTHNKILTRINKIPFVRDQGEIAYQKAVKKHIIYLPHLSQSDFYLLNRIKEEGVVITTLEELGIPSSYQLLDAAKNIIPKIRTSIDSQQEEIVVHATSQQIMEYPEIFLWGLEQRLLNIIENYFGFPVAYHGVYFRRDISNQLEKGSRLWHIDREAQRVMKIIIYLNDIDENHGPFQYISQSLTSDIAHSLKYVSGYISDKIMQEFTSSENYKSCLGSIGTVVFAATDRIFHRGKIPIKSDRFALFFDYTPRSKKHSFYSSSSLPYEDLILLAENFAKSQKEHIVW
ncbi:hypothetical protein [Anabaena sp. PCC 7108]|uniref:hypothetical protein n=1 Tax=Anabaena sp. PCC 7108 TaxID=163908 RepID=UPI00034B8ED2|nr:hypothetical protein [Anabaena sp. PCC 7108]